MFELRAAEEETAAAETMEHTNMILRVRSDGCGVCGGLNARRFGDFPLSYMLQ
jgi:hypothetical protein